MSDEHDSWFKSAFGVDLGVSRNKITAVVDQVKKTAMVGDAGAASAGADAADAGTDAAEAAAKREAERGRRLRSRALDDIECELRLLRRSFR